MGSHSTLTFQVFLLDLFSYNEWPDDDPVKGRNIVAKYQIYLYLVKSCVRRHHTDT
jgi:hypothetical protein